jgi:hypothetical protein
MCFDIYFNVLTCSSSFLQTLEFGDLKRKSCREVRLCGDGSNAIDCFILPLAAMTQIRYVNLLPQLEGVAKQSVIPT